MRWAALVLVALGCHAAAASRAWGEGAPDELRIEAQVMRGGPGENATVTVSIAPDGLVRATWTVPGPSEGEATTLEFRLAVEELGRVRDTVIASRFFETWGPGVPEMHSSSWTVRVRLGDQDLRRVVRGRTSEFEPLRQYLQRFVEQLSITVRLRRGDYHAAGAMPYGYFPGVAHLPAILDELVACAAGQATPTRCAKAADSLLAVAGTGDWLPPARSLLARIEGDRRAEVLLAWAGRLNRPEHAGRRAAFAPILLAEVEALAARWMTLTPPEKLAFEFMLRRLLLDGDARAFELAERMARAVGEPGRPFVPPGLVETGEASVPLVLRLMDAEEPQARTNGVHIAYAQIGVLRKHFGLSEALSEEARAALERRVGQDVIPALERRLQDPAEPYALRRLCVSLLDWWDGRCKVAQTLALGREAESRRRERAMEEALSLGPPPKGPLSISGRILGPLDTALPGFTVIVVREDGRTAASAVTGDDGSFRADGLTEGAHDLVVVTPGEPVPYILIAPRAAVSVDAGRDGIVVRLSGSMIRGRLLDPAGAPVAQYALLAQPRGRADEWALSWTYRATTDSVGRYWFVRLPSGDYDVVAAHQTQSSLVGGVGVATGPEERVVRVEAGAPIDGRVVDETGAPVAGAEVRLFYPGPVWTSFRNVNTSADGAFRFDEVERLRDHRVYTVVTGRDGVERGAVVEGIRGGAKSLVLGIGDGPGLRFHVAYSDRGLCEKWVRVVRISGGPVVWHQFSETPVNWVGAPPGSWRVFVHARDIDAEGVQTCTWVEAGVATTGEPEKTLTVPR